MEKVKIEDRGVEFISLHFISEKSKGYSQQEFRKLTYRQEWDLIFCFAIINFQRASEYVIIKEVKVLKELLTQMNFLLL